MKLSDAPSVDIRQRFRDELRALGLPKSVTLEGNPMQVAIAQELLRECGTGTGDGPMVRLMSMEAYGSAFLKSFLEEVPPPDGLMLLTTIPESTLVSFAQERGIPVTLEPRDDVRAMLDALAASQQQTYFSLRRSAARLAAAAEALRQKNGK